MAGHRARRQERRTRTAVPPGTCVCGKVAFASKADAKLGWKRSQFGDKVSQFRCPRNPAAWHNGHLREAVRRGEADRGVMTTNAPAGLARQLVFCCGFETTGRTHSNHTISWTCENCGASTRVHDDEANEVLTLMHTAGVRPTIALIAAACRRPK